MSANINDQDLRIRGELCIGTSAERTPDSSPPCWSVVTALKCQDQPGGTRDRTSAAGVRVRAHMRVTVVNRKGDVSRKDQKCTAEQQESRCQRVVSLIVRWVSPLSYTQKNREKRQASMNTRGLGASIAVTRTVTLCFLRCWQTISSARS